MLCSVEKSVNLEKIVFVFFSAFVYISIRLGALLIQVSHSKQALFRLKYVKKTLNER